MVNFKALSLLHFFQCPQFYSNIPCEQCRSWHCSLAPCPVAIIGHESKKNIKSNSTNTHLNIFWGSKHGKFLNTVEVVCLHINKQICILIG